MNLLFKGFVEMGIKEEGLEKEVVIGILWMRKFVGWCCGESKNGRRVEVN